MTREGDPWAAEVRNRLHNEAVTAAAKIINAEIREGKYASESCPTNDDIANVEARN